MLAIVGLPLLVLGLPWSAVAYTSALAITIPAATGSLADLQVFVVTFALVAPVALTVVIHVRRLTSAHRRHLRPAWTVDRSTRPQA